MKSILSALLRRVLIAGILCVLATAPAFVEGGDTTGLAPVNALFLLNVPQEYKAFEDFMAGVKDSGADTLMIRPFSGEGRVDKQAIAKAVFFAHASGLKLFVIVPTRSMSFLLEEHPEWEDQYYDSGSGTVQPDGKLDLFNPEVVASLVAQVKDIAGYSVDAILMDEDFNYRPTEGMSTAGLEQYKQKYAASFPARSILAGVSSVVNRSGEEQGEAFWNMAELKSRMLQNLLQELVQAGRTVNREVKFGVPLPLQGLLLPEWKTLMANYAYDVKAFRKMDIHFFWLSLSLRDIRASQDLSYKKSIEVFSRTVVSALSAVNDPGKVIIGIQASSRTGNNLPLSEIEELSNQAKKAGQPGMALMLEPSTRLPQVFLKKVFKRQTE